MNSEFRFFARVELERRLKRLYRVDEVTEIDLNYVTCAEYQLFIDTQADLGISVHPEHWSTNRFEHGKAKNPISGVSASDANAFCDWLTKQEFTPGFRYRLPTPTEAQLIDNNEPLLGFWCRAGSVFSISGHRAPIIFKKSTTSEIFLDFESNWYESRISSEIDDFFLSDYPSYLLQLSHASAIAMDLYSMAKNLEACQSILRNYYEILACIRCLNTLIKIFLVTSHESLYKEELSMVYKQVYDLYFILNGLDSQEYNTLAKLCFKLSSTINQVRKFKEPFKISMPYFFESEESKKRRTHIWSSIDSINQMLSQLRLLSKSDQKSIDINAIGESPPLGIQSKSQNLFNSQYSKLKLDAIVYALHLKYYQIGILARLTKIFSYYNIKSFDHTKDQIASEIDLLKQKFSLLRNLIPKYNSFNQLMKSVHNPEITLSQRLLQFENVVKQYESTIDDSDLNDLRIAYKFIKSMSLLNLLDTTSMKTRSCDRSDLILILELLVMILEICRPSAGPLTLGFDITTLRQSITSFEYDNSTVNIINFDLYKIFVKMYIRVRRLLYVSRLIQWRSDGVLPAYEGIRIVRERL
jgi:hypothetical protein